METVSTSDAAKISRIGYAGPYENSDEEWTCGAFFTIDADEVETDSEFDIDVGSTLRTIEIAITVTERIFVPAEFEKVESITDFFDLFSGFIDGTSMLNGPSFTECENRINEYEEHIQTTVLYFIGTDLTDPPIIGVQDWLLTLDWDNADAYVFYLINDELIWMLGNLYQLANDCYYGGFEVLGGLSDYVYWASNPEIIQSNIINDAGYIYNTVRDLTMFYLQSERSLIRTNFEFGRAFG